MGMASFMRTVDAADDLPVTYTFALADDQDDKLDGGETVETDDPIEYVHHERGQVKGYTGNILGEDYRDDSLVQISVRHVDANGRHMQFAADDWKDKATAPNKTRHSLGNGIIKFTGNFDPVVNANTLAFGSTASGRIRFRSAVARPRLGRRRGRGLARGAAH